MSDGYTPKAVWNMDSERMKVLNYFMLRCEDSFMDWNLEELYANLRALRRVFSGKLKTTEFNVLEEKFKVLEELRRTMNPENEIEFNKKRIDFYNKCDDIYVQLNIYMKAHGIFFREGKDPTRAALER